eukprot:scaffold112686_cov39-Phaeocystis_antarctica.AAC.1
MAGGAGSNGAPAERRAQCVLRGATGGPGRKKRQAADAVGAAGAAGAATWCCGRAPRRSWRAVIDAHRVTDLLVAGLDGGEVEDDDDAAVLHGVADELVQPDDAELLQLTPQHPARTVSAV